MSKQLPQHALPRLYRAADAFVLPSRGEGWGRPHVEAMSMGLPVIATNWSGPTAFLDEEVGYPLDYTLEDLPASMPPAAMAAIGIAGGKQPPVASPTRT